MELTATILIRVKTSLTLPLYIEVPVPSQESERSYICVAGVSVLSPYGF